MFASKLSVVLRSVKAFGAVPASSRVGMLANRELASIFPIMRSHVSFAPVGYPAPDFTADALIGREFSQVSLSNYKGKWVVLFFYPLDFTFVCPTEIVAFSDKAEEFRKIGAEVLGCSVDSKFAHFAWVDMPRKEGGLGKCNFPLIADVSHNIGEMYGVMNADTGFHLRGTYIIDPAGVVRHLSMNAPPVGRNVDELLRLVQAFQFSDKNGEVCPSDWKPGKDTIIEDPVKKKKYFAKNARDE